MSRLLLSVIAFAAAAMAQPLTYTIDTSHSSADFSVRHMMVSNVKGSFGKTTGTIVYDAKNLAASSVDATIDATSINTRNEQRDNHLRSADFFDVAKYPTITFKSKQWYRENGHLKIKGDLTLHGVTKEVVLDVDGPSPEVSGMGGFRIGATATTKINRKDFGLTWNRALEAGGVTVGEEVSISIDIEALRKG